MRKEEPENHFRLFLMGILPFLFYHF